MCPAGVTGVERMEPFESVQVVDVESAVRVVVGELLDGLPCAAECVVCLVLLSSASTDLRVDGVCAGPDGRARSFVCVCRGGDGDPSGSFQIIGRVQGHHGVAGSNRSAMASILESCGCRRGIGVQGRGGVVVVGLEGQPGSEDKCPAGELAQFVLPSVVRLHS